MRDTQLLSESVTYLNWIIEITTFVFADLNADVHVCNARIFIHMRTAEKYTAAHKYLLNVTSFTSWCFINMSISDDKVYFFAQPVDKGRGARSEQWWVNFMEEMEAKLSMSKLI